MLPTVAGSLVAVVVLVVAVALRGAPAGPEGVEVVAENALPTPDVEEQPEPKEQPIQPDAARGEWVLTVGPTGDLKVLELTVGECASRDPFVAFQLDRAAAAPCDLAHEAEVLAREELVASSAALNAANPWDYEVLDEVEWWCMVTLERYVDVSYEESELAYVALVPDAERWDAGEREVACLAVPYDTDDLVGSVRGSGR